jgi:hypothetical protein
LSSGAASGYAWRSLRTYLLILAIPLLFCVHANDALAAPGVTLKDPEHGFSLVLPEAYVDYPEGKGPNILHAFARGNPGDESFGLLQLQSLDGPIGRDPLLHDAVERSAHESIKSSGAQIDGFEYRKIPWKSFELELVVTRISGGDKHLITLATQIPLSKRALQLGMSGTAADEARLAGEMQSIVASVEGKSNWLSEDERSDKISSFIGSGVGVLIGLGIVFWWRRRRARS